MSEPLIYTKYGNVPADSVELHIEWKFGEFIPELKMPRFIACREFYTDKRTGEIVKDGTHAYSAVGVTASSAVGGMGG